MISVQCFIHTSLWSVNKRQEWRNFPPCVQQTQIKYVFQHFCLSEGLRTGTIWSQPPKLIGGGKCNPTVIKQMKMTSVPPHHGSSMLPEMISEATLVAECAKREKKKRTKVCWCVKADKVVSSVATFFYLMAGLSKCISSLSGCPVREKMHKDSPVDTVGSHSISVPLSLLPYLD